MVMTRGPCLGVYPQPRTPGSLWNTSQQPPGTPSHPSPPQITGIWMSLKPCPQEINQLTVSDCITLNPLKDDGDYMLLASLMA